MQVNEWSLREEVLAITHRWQWPMLAFLVGCLLGWGLSYLLPTQYRTERILSVAYNADAIYRNPDDYKNWMLSQLDALAVAPDVLQETLARLQQKDPYWQEWTVEQLAASLDVLWQNTGVWRLAAEADTSEHASQVLQIWSEVFLNKYQEALQAATTLSELEPKHANLGLAQTTAQVHLSQLRSLQNALLNWQEAALSKESSEKPSEQDRWRLWSIISNAAGFDPAWKSILDTFPGEEATLSDFLLYLEQVEESLNLEITTFEDLLNDLEQERLLTATAYELAMQGSRGLSAKVYVTPSSDDQSVATPLRSPSMLALAGGILGLLVWGLVWLGRLRKRTDSQ